MRFYKTISLVCILYASVFSMEAIAQDAKTGKEDEANYTKVITQRANKIVVTLNITDSSKFYQVQDIIVQQYRNLRFVHDNSNALLSATKTAELPTKEAKDEAIKKVEDGCTAELDKFHSEYIGKLSALLSPEQIISVKDGMTYNILPITYKAYQEMLPNLTEEQKKQIYAWLVEAREHAIDAESSDKKHAWFGKYKGRINNYLSAQGIDMKKAGDEWQERIKAKKNQ